MKTIEDRLTRVAAETQAQVATMELGSNGSIRSIRRRHRSQRILAGVGTLALVLAAFGVTSMVVSSEPDLGPGAESATPPTTVATPDTTAAAGDDVTVTTIAPTEPPSATENRPHLGLTLDGWVPVLAFETGDTSSAVYYSDEASNKAGIDGARVAIEIWSDLPGSLPNSGYEHAFESLVVQGEALAHVTLADGATVAAAFTFADPNTGAGGFAFLWQSSPTVSVEVLTYVETSAEATEIIQSIEPLSDFDWNAILDEVGDSTPAETTTTVVEDT